MNYKTLLNLKNWSSSKLHNQSHLALVTSALRAKPSSRTAGSSYTRARAGKGCSLAGLLVPVCWFLRQILRLTSQVGPNWRLAEQLLSCQSLGWPTMLGGPPHFKVHLKY